MSTKKILFYAVVVIAGLIVLRTVVSSYVASRAAGGAG